MLDQHASRPRRTGEQLRDAAARRQRQHAERKLTEGYVRFAAWVPKDFAMLLRSMLRDIGGDQRPQQRLVERAEMVAARRGVGLPLVCRDSRLACRLFLLSQE